MRYERHGGPPDLPAYFNAFVERHLRGRLLDDDHAAESAEGEFPDFGLFRDLVLIEMKNLESEQKDRVISVVNENANPDEWPVFYGEREIVVNRAEFSNADRILRAIFTKLSRSIEGVLRKADRQFGAYRKRNPRKNQINICVILNSTIREYTPEVVVKAIHTKMKVNGESEPRFQNIDAVLYLSEKHFFPAPNGQLACPVITYEGAGALAHEWKVPVVDRIVREWVSFRTGENLEGQIEVDSDSGLQNFGIVEDIPDKMSRSDAWLLEYARDPYLKSLVLSALRLHYHRLIALNSRTFIKGGWDKPPKEETADGLRRFQHCIAETNRRRVDMRELDAAKLTIAEREAVLAGLPQELKDILQRRMRYAGID